MGIRYDGVPGTYVDIVGDVINAVVATWAAENLVTFWSFDLFCCVISSLNMLCHLVRYNTKNGGTSEGTAYGARGLRYVCNFGQC
jgi:hypothetical protein